MGLLFMFVAIVVEFAIAVLVIWQANKRFGKKRAADRNLCRRRSHLARLHLELLYQLAF